MVARKELPQGFYWRGGVIWIRTDPVSGKARSTGSRSLDGAESFRARREQIKADPLHAAAASQTVGEWAKRTCKLKSQTKSEGTAGMYETKLGHWVRIFGARCPMVDIDANAIDRFIERRQTEGVTNNTIQRELTCGMQMLKLARRAGAYHLEPSQVKPFNFSAGYVPRTTHLAPDELPLILAALSPERAAWVGIAIATGGDISDVERIQLADYDPTTQTIRMRGTKNRFRAARIPVPDAFLPLLEAALPFLPLSWPRVSKDLPELCIKLGVTRVTPKDLRRTASTWLSEAGVPLDVLGRWMRHGGAKVAFDVYDQRDPTATGAVIREHLQKRDSRSRPPGGMADAADLKAATSDVNTQKHSPARQPGAQGNSGKQLGADTDLLQRAEARIRRLRPLAAMDPSYRPALAAAMGVVEAYHLADGDDDAPANLERLLGTMGGAA